MIIFGLCSSFGNNNKQTFITLITTPEQSGTLTYTGSTLSPLWTGYNETNMTISGTTSAINVGSYVVTFTPAENCYWSDTYTNEPKEVTWSIDRAIINLPSQSGILTYNGSTQSPSWSGYDSTKMTLSGTISGTDAIDYTATFTPTANYKWSDNSTSAKNVIWTINKATGTLSLSKTSITLNPNTTSSTFTITTNSDGIITVSSNNTSIATVSLSDKTVTVTAKSGGTAIITVSIAAATNYTSPSNKTCNVNVTGLFPSYSYTGTSSLKNASDYGLNGNYQVLALTGSGVFSSSASFAADIFMVGGGAGGNEGAHHGGAGGGSGRTITNRNINISTQPIAVTIGAGGPGGTGGGSYSANLGSVGGNTVFGTYSVSGGSVATSAIEGGAGGSGGGGVNGGYGNWPQYDGCIGGSDGSDGASGDYAGGSGQGTTTRAFGESNATLFAGGGGGGGQYSSGKGAAGGAGGGGAGGSVGRNGTNGTTNTGGGGGGGGGGYNASGYDGGTGGSGIILIRPAQ